MLWVCLKWKRSLVNVGALLFAVKNTLRPFVAAQPLLASWTKDSSVDLVNARFPFPFVLALWEKVMDSRCVRTQTAPALLGRHGSSTRTNTLRRATCTEATCTVASLVWQLVQLFKLHDTSRRQRLTTVHLKWTFRVGERWGFRLALVSRRAEEVSQPGTIRWLPLPNAPTREPLLFETRPIQSQWQWQCPLQWSWWTVGGAAIHWIGTRAFLVNSVSPARWKQKMAFSNHPATSSSNSSRVSTLRILSMNQNILKLLNMSLLQAWNLLVLDMSLARAA